MTSEQNDSITIPCKTRFTSKPDQSKSGNYLKTPVKIPITYSRRLEQLAKAEGKSIPETIAGITCKWLDEWSEE